MHKKLTDQKQRIESLRNHYAFKDPLHQILQFSQKVDDTENRLKSALKNKIQLKKEKIKTLEGLLQSLSPYKILKRGYSVTLDQKTRRPIRSLKDLKTKNHVITRIQDGEFTSEVLNSSSAYSEKK
jgi:exodeoxyribonuclease VII large subunit